MVYSNLTASRMYQHTLFGQHTTFVSELPSLKHCCAVALNDRRCVHVLVYYHGNATKAEPASGMSALTVAFSKYNDKLAAFLMHYGADPDVQDGKGATARSLAKKPELQELIDRWDKDGAMAFEVC